MGWKEKNGLDFGSCRPMPSIQEPSESSGATLLNDALAPRQPAGKPFEGALSVQDQGKPLVQGTGLSSGALGQGLQRKKSCG